MTAELVAPPLPVKRMVVLSAAVVLIAMSIVWAYLSMRAVMGVGGACADGGPYVVAQPCPDGTWLIAVAIPLMLLAAFSGSIASVSLNAPDLFLPMWFLLFGMLGANFLEFGLWSDPWDWGWLVCGVVFELMAFPALYFMLPISGERAPKTREEKKFAKALAARGASAASPRTKLLWWLAYVVLGGCGATIGWFVWDALR